MTAVIQRSFSGGELAPSLYARVDTIKYATGLRTCRNFIILRHGGVANRPGTRFIGEVKDSTKRVRLIPFVFNPDQTYVLEFGNLYMRVVRNAGYVTETALAITAITNANPCVVSIIAHGYSNGDEVFISGVGGMTELNNRNFKVFGATANTFQLQNLDGTFVDSTSFGVYTSGGTAARIFTLVTPYVEADLSTLQYVQSADVVTIVHPNYDPRELRRTGHTSWTLTTITFVPSISAPTGTSATGLPGAFQWVVTALAAETFEESLQSTAANSADDPETTPVTISWTNVAGAVEYNVYRKVNNLFSFVGVAGGSPFVDNQDNTPDSTTTPPQSRNPFSGAGNFPSTVNYIQQRLTFANTNNNPEKLYGSRIGFFHNFTISTPIQDDDSITFTMAGKQVNEVRHLIDLRLPVVTTTSGEWVLAGSASGGLTPSEINPQQQSYYGSSELSPIVIGSTALFVQARGSIVRDLAFDFQADGYRGNDLTIFSSHLFDNFSLVDWTFQQIPHSIAWAARSDGKLLGLTYIREHQIFGWHRHDFDGTVENTCVIPEGLEDALYLIINRTINNRTVRYLERFNTRQLADVVDSVFVDSSLKFDGRNTNTSHAMTLSGGSTWSYTETLTLTSSLSFFAASDVGNGIHLTGSDGTLIRFTITGFTSATVVTGKPHATVPLSIQNVAISSWAKAVDQVFPLFHLEGKNVSVFADGFVVANPNNPAYTLRTVTNGILTLDKPYTVINVGLPYLPDLETLDIDTTQSETLSDKKKNISKVSMNVEASRGIWIGSTPPTGTNPIEGLTELKIRNNENYNDPVSLVTEVVDVLIRPEWNSNGRVFVRQIDPVPLSVLSVVPTGLIPFR